MPCCQSINNQCSGNIIVVAIGSTAFGMWLHLSSAAAAVLACLELTNLYHCSSGLHAQQVYQEMLLMYNQGLNVHTNPHSVADVGHFALAVHEYANNASIILPVHLIRCLSHVLYSTYCRHLKSTFSHKRSNVRKCHEACEPKQLQRHVYRFATDALKSC